MLTRLSFPCLVVCHSRTRCGNLSFFLQQRLLAASITCLFRYGLTPALHRSSSPLLACGADNAEAQIVAATVPEFLSAFCRIPPFFHCRQAVAVCVFILAYGSCYYISFVRSIAPFFYIRFTIDSIDWSQTEHIT